MIGDGTSDLSQTSALWILLIHFGGREEQEEWPRTTDTVLGYLVTALTELGVRIENLPCRRTGETGQSFLSPSPNMGRASTSVTRGNAMHGILLRRPEFPQPRHVGIPVYFMVERTESAAFRPACPSVGDREAVKHSGKSSVSHHLIVIKGPNNLHSGDFYRIF